MKTVMLKCRADGTMQLNPGSRPGKTPTTYNIAVVNVPNNTPDIVVCDTVNNTIVASSWDLYIWDWLDFGHSNIVNYYTKKQPCHA